MGITRRKFALGMGGLILASGGASAGAYYFVSPNEETSPDESGENNTTSPDEAPEAVQASFSLARSFHQTIKAHYDARIKISRKGEIAMEYSSQASSGDALNQEFHDIALIYINVIAEGDYNVKTLTMTTGDVRATVTRSAIEAHLKGNIDEEAFLQTILVGSRGDPG